METQTRNITVLNRASVKRYALKVSAQRRAGKFTRVGEEFYERCEARLETALRGIANLHGTDESPSSENTFITTTTRSKAEEMLEILSRRIIFSEVLRHPSMGCTLK